MQRSKVSQYDTKAALEAKWSIYSKNVKNFVVKHSLSDSNIKVMPLPEDIEDVVNFYHIVFAYLMKLKFLKYWLILKNS